jgi:hypothetical protein
VITTRPLHGELAVWALALFPATDAAGLAVWADSLPLGTDGPEAKVGVPSMTGTVTSRWRRTTGQSRRYTYPQLIRTA